MERKGNSVAVDMDMPILIVGDYRTMLKIIQSLLKRLGFGNVDEATDGGAALQKIRNKNYGPVISDWNMEPTSGLQPLKEVRLDAKLQDVPFTPASLAAILGSKINTVPAGR